MNGDSEDNVGEVSALWTRVDQADRGQAEALPRLHDSLLGHRAGGVADGQAAEEEARGRGMTAGQFLLGAAFALPLIVKALMVVEDWAVKRKRGGWQ